MTIKWSRSSIARVDGGSQAELITKLAQSIARVRLFFVKAEVGDLTDESGGSIDENDAQTKYVVHNDILPNLTNTASGGTNVASTASALAALELVREGLEELANKANAFANGIGLPELELSLNGSIDDIIPNLGAATGAATGCQAAQVNHAITSLRNGFFTVAHFINSLCVATGSKEIEINLAGEIVEEIAIDLTITTTATPGVSKASFDQKLADFAVVIATLAAALNRCAQSDADDINHILVVA